SYMPCPDFLSLPCLASSSQTAGGNWLGGSIATMSARLPAVIGLRLSFESSPSCVSFSRLLKALKAAFSSSLLAVSAGVGVSDILQSSHSRAFILAQERLDLRVLALDALPNRFRQLFHFVGRLPLRPCKPPQVGLHNTHGSTNSEAISLGSF